MNHKTENNTLPDIKQSFWQLAVIQLAGIASLPVLASSVLISQTTNFIDAITTIALANIILWIIRFGIISMSHKDRKSTLDISREYFGTIGSYFIAVLLLASTLAWFVAQTTLASNALTFLIPINVGEGVDRFVQTSVALGIISTLLCMEGIVALRWLATLIYPFLLIAFLGVLFTTPKQILSIEPVSITFSLLPLALGTNLGITADLPTFFRHSKSWKDSVNALTILQLVSLIIGIAGLFLGSAISPWLEDGSAESFIAVGHGQKSFLVALIFISVICANVSNVYSASVGWEVVAPTLAGRKEYLILGFGLTIIFILVAHIFSMHSLLDITDASLINLALVLVLGYVIYLLTGRAPKIREQMIYLFAWLVATTLNILQFSELFAVNHSSLFIAILAILCTIVSGFTIKKLLTRTKA